MTDWRKLLAGSSAAFVLLSGHGCLRPPPPDAPAALASKTGSLDGTTDVAIASGSGPDHLAFVAMQRNPAVQAAEAKVRRLLAKVPQAGALPDPKLRLSAGSMAETAAGRVDWMTGVEQALPFPGKLKAMAEAAGKEAEAAAAELAGLRLEVAEQVRSAYWDWYLARRTTAITGETQNALSLVRDSIDARVAANQATQDDQLRLASEFGKLEQTLLEARRAESAARARLNALLARPRESTLPANDVEAVRRPADLEALLHMAEAEHPSVAAAEAEVEAFRHRLRGAELARYPDFMIGLQHAAISDAGLAPSANGRDQLFATLGLSLPLWPAPRQARLAEAEAGIDEATAKVADARARLRFRVEDAWLRLRTSDEILGLFEGQLLPESKQAFDLALTGYATGTKSFVDVLDAWRTWLGLRLQQAAQEAQRGKAAAALRSASGRGI